MRPPVGARGLLVGLKGLGGELAGERDDLVGRNIDPAIFDCLAERNVSN
jgi:hypothetical protein